MGSTYKMQISLRIISILVLPKIPQHNLIGPRQATNGIGRQRTMMLLCKRSIHVVKARIRRRGNRSRVVTVLCTTRPCRDS